MKITFLISFIINAFIATLACEINPAGIPDKIILTGKITDKITGYPLSGVNIYLPDLKRGATTDSAGIYKIENLPATKILIQVIYTGYKFIAARVDLSITHVQDFELEESINELHEVVVTGLSKAAEKNRTPTPVTTIPQIQLIQNSATNITDLLSKQAGVSQITTGSGISKPVLRGLGFNRIVTINDGIRQEGQQWGDEHGVEIDEFSVSKVEILKGAASLSYGSDAMAGVINMVGAPTLPEGEISGAVIGNYQTNNGLIGISANVAGNRRGFIWDLRYSNKNAHAYQNKFDGYVLNSGFNENAVSSIIGLNKSWGYSHLHVSMYNMSTGIAEGERDSLTGKFVKPVAINDTLETTEIASENDFTSYSRHIPYQEINHYKFALNNSFIAGDGSLKAILGWQQNRRREYDDILDENKYGLYFQLNTFNYDLRYILPEKNSMNISFGINGMQQSSLNKGSEFLIPEYNLFDIGVFAILKKSIGRFDVSGGLRFDSRAQHVEDLYLDPEGNVIEEPLPGSYRQFTAFDASFTGLSGSIGATYQFSEITYAKLNLSRGFRAPNIAELGANGIHEGTLRYELGNSKLKAESSLQFDLSMGVNFEHVTAELDLFHNSINNYIFSRKLESAFGGDSITQGYNTFQFIEGDANLYGGELIIDIHPHPLDWLHFENTVSFVQAIQNNQPDSTKYLPLTPATRITTELKADTRKLGKYLANAFFKIGMENYLKQDQFYAAFGTETETPGYTLFNVGIGADVTNKKTTLFSLFINVNNLTDVAYQSHLSRLKYTAVNNATGRTGIYNMGRNISVKVVVPVGNR